jgi:hypothetical protein
MPQTDRWGGSLYYLQQNTSGITDRRALGMEARYFDSRRTLYLLLDYDLAFRAANIAMAQGNWQSEAKSNFFFLTEDPATASDCWQLGAGCAGLGIRNGRGRRHAAGAAPQHPGLFSTSHRQRNLQTTIWAYHQPDPIADAHRAFPFLELRGTSTAIRRSMVFAGWQRTVTEPDVAPDPTVKLSLLREFLDAEGAIERTTKGPHRLNTVVVIFSTPDTGGISTMGRRGDPGAPVADPGLHAEPGVRWLIGEPGSQPVWRYARLAAMAQLVLVVIAFVGLMFSFYRNDFGDVLPPQ